MITTFNLLLVGVALFSFFAFTSPEPCPRKYLDLGGGVIKYCELDYGLKWVLKNEF